MRVLKLFVFVSFHIFLLSMIIAAPSSKMAFWGGQKKGANVFNHTVTVDLIKKAKTYGIAFIRLAPDKFPSQERDL